MVSLSIAITNYPCVHSDINVCDKQGRSALHLVATSNSIHAKRMVSLLVKQGSNAGV